jgi:hypothetical protein
MAVVYFHRRKDTNEVFYVGIGSKVSRSSSKSDRSEFWWKVVNKYGYIIDVIQKGLTWEEACKEEIRLIKLYGRRDKNLGPLVNLTDGGDGKLGCKHTEESKRKSARPGKLNGMYGVSLNGSKNGRAKLNEEIVLKIRNIYSTTKISQQKLGDLFNIPRGTVKHIVNKTTWTHI